MFGAYCAGVGVNGIVPARGGDAIKLLLVHSRIEGATYPTLGASLLAETVFDMGVGILLWFWAWQIGIADGLLRLSVGLEDPDDLIEALDRGLERVLAAKPRAVACGAGVSPSVIGNHETRGGRDARTTRGVEPCAS